MLKIDHSTLREGLDRASDLLKLHRLSTPEDAELLAQAVFANFGIDELGQIFLTDSLRQMLPMKTDPVVERVLTSSMSAGVLVGLVLANSATRPERDAIPDCPPVDL